MARSTGVVLYRPEDNEDFYEKYYAVQRGSGFSVFSGRTVMPTYSADGNGLGDLFRSFLGVVKPLFTKVALKSGAKALGKAALNAGVQTVADLSADRIKNAVVRNVVKAGGDLAQQARTKIREQHRKRLASGPPALLPPPSKKKTGPLRRKGKGQRRVSLGVLG